MILKLFKYIILIVLLNLFYLCYLIFGKSDDKFKEIEKYIKFNLAGNLSLSPSLFYNRKCPEISIIISTFNGETYLKPAVRSIQN